MATQQRAAATIRAAIDATADLLDRYPEELVTVDAIRRRSGVSQGSLTHHFGRRDAIIAAAQTERYVRTCARDEAFLRDHGLVDGIDEPDAFVRALLTVVARMTAAERHALRWVRMSAIAGALWDDQLWETLTRVSTSLLSLMTSVVEGAQRAGIVIDTLDARTVAVVMTTHARGLVLDDLAGTEPPADAWRHLQTRFLASFLTSTARATIEREEVTRFGDLWRAEVFGGPGRVPVEVADRLEMLRTRAGTDDGPLGRAATMPEEPRALLLSAARSDDQRRTRPRPSTAALRRRIVAMTVEQLRIGGARTVEIGRIREAVDLSPQAFNRLVGDRSTLIRLARLEVETTRAERGLRRLAAAIDASRDAATLRAGIEARISRIPDDEARASASQRFETLAAARTDPELSAPLARLQVAARDLLIEQVCRAQAAGLIDATLPPREVARFLDGIPLWPIYYALDAERPSWERWVPTVRHIAVFLSPDATSDRGD